MKTSAPCVREPTVRRPDRRAGGFTVMEALISIAILAGGLTALYGVQQTMVAASLRTERAMDLLTARRTAAGFLSGVDFFAFPEGTADLGGGWTLSWRVAEGGAESGSGYYGLGSRRLYAVGVGVVEAGLEGPSGVGSTWSRSYLRWSYRG